MKKKTVTSETEEITKEKKEGKESLPGDPVGQAG